MMKLMERYQAWKSYNKAEKQVIVGKFSDAIRMLSEYKGPPLYQAKASLLMAVTYHKALAFRQAAQSYQNFLTEHLEHISRDNDRAYLAAYAKYFAQLAQEELGMYETNVTYASEVKRLHGLATLATRGEFPFTLEGRREG